LYRIATNQCLSALRSAKRRPAKEWNIPNIEPPQPTRLGEIVWLEPYPDALLTSDASAAPLGPEARLEQSEAISLAFITALQVLPARQRAVLILREALGYHAAEVAEILGSTTESVTSALKRARAALARHMPPEDEQPVAPDSQEERALVAKFVRAYQAGDVEALVALLAEDVRLSMPPIPLEYHGRTAVAGFYASIFHLGRRYDLIPTYANGQPAFGAYLHSGDGGIRHGAGLLVLTFRGSRISELARFDNDMLPLCGLPRSLPA
jgi:RNA polymerase sigma-70 factor (ECF subfamily)